MWLVYTVAGIVCLFLVTVVRGAPYVPSQKRFVKQAFTKLYKLGSDDVVVDVGSGDGIVLRMASSIGARAVGFELNPVLVFITHLLSMRDARVSVYMRDFMICSLPKETTVVYCFSEKRDIKKIYNKIVKESERLQKTVYFISLAFAVPGIKEFKYNEPYYLYKITPLHSR